MIHIFLLNMISIEVTLAQGLILFVLIYIQGVSATCTADGNEVVAVINSRDINVISNIPVVPRCIQCGYLQSSPLALIYITDPDEVIYIAGGTQIMNGSINGVTIFNDGLLVEDPASSFSNDDDIRCQFNIGFSTVTHTVTFIISDFLPPPITPNGTVLDYVEGDDVTLTCTGNTIANDQYQWTLPDGSTIPPNPAVADSGLDVELKNVNRTDSGVYNCTGTISGESISVVSSVTLNIQYPAKVISFSTSATILPVTTTLTLNCSFEGNPTPSVLWFHNDTIIGIQNNPSNNYDTFDVTFTSINDSGLYSCGVSNSIGNEGSDQINVTAQVAPDPVAVFQSNSFTRNSITLSWSYGFNGNAPITGVDITYTATSNYGNGLNMGDESGSISTDQLSITIPNLQPLTTYQFSITVNNSVSDTVGSSAAITVSTDTLPIAPYTPTSVNVTAIDSTSLTVTWTASIDSFIETPLLHFVLRYNILDNSTTEEIIISNGVARSHVITGLRKGTIYQVRVQSVNSADDPSPFSDSEQGKTDIDAPSEVVNFQPTSNPFSICVQWSESEDNGGQMINGYAIYLWNRDDFEMENYVFVSNVGASVLTYTIENLNNNTEYFIRVAASNEHQGFGMNSTINTTTGQPLQVDPNFNVTIDRVTAISAKAIWTSTSDNIQYRLQIARAGNDFDPDKYTNFTTISLQAVLNNLDPRTFYDLRMTRIEGGGCTRRVSEITTFETLALEVEVTAPPTATEGEDTMFVCRLSTGENATNVTWKYQGGPLSEGAVANGHILTLTNLVVTDTGNYSCISREGTLDEATFTFFIMIEERPVVPSSPSPMIMPTLESGSATEAPTASTLSVWIPVAAAVGGGLALFLVVAVILVIMVICYWRVIKVSQSKSSTVATINPSDDVIVDDNNAYGMRDTQLIREQQVIYEPPIVAEQEVIYEQL